MGSGNFYIVHYYGSGNFVLKYGRNYGSITIGHTGQSPLNALLGQPAEWIARLALSQWPRRGSWKATLHNRRFLTS